MKRAALFAAAMIAAAGSSSVAHAAGDPGNGKTVFARCGICHNATKGGPDGIGPNLFGVVGRKAATRPSFSYSTALKNSGITWTADKLDAWITSPAKLVPGNRMAFAGIADAKQRADLVAYLGTLK
jgi:cytochrome c